MDNVIYLNNLFQNRIFRVPDYQRGYSWERQQVSEFLDDLELLAPGRYHYTGTVVLHEPDPKSALMDIEGNTYTPAGNCGRAAEAHHHRPVAGRDPPVAGRQRLLRSRQDAVARNCQKLHRRQRYERAAAFQAFP